MLTAGLGTGDLRVCILMSSLSLRVPKTVEKRWLIPGAAPEHHLRSSHICYISGASRDFLEFLSDVLGGEGPSHFQSFLKFYRKPLFPRRSSDPSATRQPSLTSGSSGSPVLCPARARASAVPSRSVILPTFVGTIFLPAIAFFIQPLRMTPSFMT